MVKKALIIPMVVALLVVGPLGFACDSEGKSAPQAGFTAETTSGCCPLQVQFTDRSRGEVTGWEWDFGDGSTSTTQSPSHTYTSPGKYTVSLKAIGPGGSRTETKTNYIEVTDCPPEAGFTAEPTSGTAPLAVHFTDQSGGNITDWEWDFDNDGTVDSTEPNPSHTYDALGTYTVSLTVTGPGGSHTETKTNYIEVTIGPPEARFTAESTTGMPPIVVQFTDQSLGEITDWEWDFDNDGTVDSTEQNPSHTYDAVGTYTVCLTVSNPNGSDTLNKAVSITTFPDANLELAIREEIGKPEGAITQADLEPLTEIDASSKAITDLTGLQYCNNLTLLSLNFNQISDISPLQNLTSLTDLWLQANYQISDITPLANLTNLTELFLQGNRISDITPLANLTNLTRLGLSANQISDISTLENLTSLTDLSLWGIQTNDISPLAGLTSLNTVNLGRDQISDISPLAGLTNLTSLLLWDNQISDISPLQNLTSLTQMSLWGNQISDISTLQNLPGLWQLDLHNNQISDISTLQNLPGLWQLDLGDNQITDIQPLVNNTGFSEGYTVELSNNPLSATSIYTYIPQLEARGVVVIYGD